MYLISKRQVVKYLCVKMARRQSLPAWMREHVRVTDGPQAGQAIRLEPWQRGLLDAVDREHDKTTHAVMAASQLGKTVCAIPTALRSALDGDGTLLVSATDHGCKDLRRRLDRILTASPTLGAAFAGPRSGPGARSSWNSRETDSGGWLAIATAGSPSQLASRTVRTVVADELARWPRLVRGGEGAPLQLLEARQDDWGTAAAMLAISSPVHRGDLVDQLFRDGDRRVLTYRCPKCGDRTRLEWDHVTGRERGEEPAIACAICGTVHGEAARRRMLRSAKWTPTRSEPTDERCASYQLSRLDSARYRLADVCYGWRKARIRVERGDPRALAAWRNLQLGLPSASGAADVDRLFERRAPFRLDNLEQCTAGCDVQEDRIYAVVLGWSAGDRDVWVMAHEEVLGDPRDDETWLALDGVLGQSYGGLPITCATIDAGYLTSHVRRQCSRRRWWIPAVGRAGEGRPIARPISRASGLCTVGVDDGKAWWSSAVRTGRVHLDKTLDRPRIAQLCAAEALHADGGKLVWKPVEGRVNHLFDSAVYALHSRRFRPLTRARRPFRLVAV